MAQPTVSAGLISSLIDYAISLDVDAEKIFAGLDIRSTDLKDPDGRLPFIHYIELMRQVKKLTNDPALALHWGEDVGMSEISILGLIMNASATMGEAFLQLQRYGRLAVEVDSGDESPNFELIPEEGKLYMVQKISSADAFPELTENGFVRLVCGPRRFLAQPHVLSVHLTYPEPPYMDEYERIFQCPVYFNTKWNALELHPETATWKVEQNPRYIFNLLTERAENLVQKLKAQKTIRGKLEAKLLKVIHKGDVSADTIATEMSMSRQTLFRKLKDEDTNFTTVLENLRHRLAIQYLRTQKTSVNEAAYLVGFSDPASFSRAFKRWTGVSPRDYK